MTGRRNIGPVTLKRNLGVLRPAANLLIDRMKFTRFNSTTACRRWSSDRWNSAGTTCGLADDDLGTGRKRATMRRVTPLLIRQAPSYRAVGRCEKVARVPPRRDAAQAWRENILRSSLTRLPTINDSTRLRTVLWVFALGFVLLSTTVASAHSPTAQVPRVLARSASHASEASPSGSRPEVPRDFPALVALPLAAVRVRIGASRSPRANSPRVSAANPSAARLRLNLGLDP